ncbi:diadenosine tetraphosphatase ApaH/serine/threonine PP2A family protein phosphatase [Pararhizobium capsulatum DSM 1112]|uniref:Diadenosine tetraphosphatase ApaH/serine/threonine PP2A family protein phosphatase n=1 Tax=Pararhizobium capsulatum DSM 1112 TaxID=1121113 RepID=A0ABU0BQA3_9HYPH|nr:metallophosphoesterase family protein [Pararhizobium capsulatum]MDQ0319866.1 diadenosine tetraphosphatase ApaH/serine/threonine PP2A family protein phosphatase [Pararhizobium capsulatum DSM 1112]
MQIAVIADIHGNDLALEAVLTDIEHHGITDIVNLGDHLSSPLNAACTVDILMARNFPSVRGNHDRWLVTLDPADMGRSDRAAFDQLSSHHLEWLRSLPATLIYHDEILLCHGTPESDIDYWLEDLTPKGIVHMADRHLIRERLAGVDFPVVLCAHTHVARMVRLPDGPLIVNPGSVGCQGYYSDEPIPHKVETGSPDASYAILTKINGKWDATFRRVAYDHSAMASLARERGREEWANVLETGWLDPASS